MSQWHREHPELAGTDADPWMQHASYREATRFVRSLDPDTYCTECQEFLEHGERRRCDECKGANP